VWLSTPYAGLPVACLVEILNIHAKPEKLRHSRGKIVITNDCLLHVKDGKTLRQNWHFNSSPRL
jgi:hypothetical protein